MLKSLRQIFIALLLLSANISTAQVRSTTLQQVGPSLIDGTSQSATVVQQGLDGRTLLTYQQRDGGPARALVFANELVVSAGNIPAVSARAQLEEAVRRTGLELQIVRQIPGRNIFLVRSKAAGVIAPGTIAEQLRLPAEFRVEPNIAFSAHANQDLMGTGIEQQWAFRNIGLVPGMFGSTPDADIDGFEAIIQMRHLAPSLGRRPTVAVQDSGLDLAHPALKSSLWVNTKEVAGNGIDDDRNGFIDDVNGWDFLSNGGMIADFHGHGTHVAGIIASAPTNRAGLAVAFGLAPTARIMPLRILTGYERDPLYASLFAVLDAHSYARTNGADIINMSYGGYVSSALLAEEVAMNHKAGIHQVAAAGNGLPEGQGADLNKHPFYPCVLPYVICVASTGADDKLSSFSNFGIRDQQQNLGVAIAAPGEEILSTWPGGGYRLSSGTSMATPMVTAVLANANALYPQESKQDHRVRVLGAADRLAGLKTAVDEGRRLNAYQALFEKKPSGVSLSDHNPYCSAWITDRESGQPIQRWRNRPYANSGEPGIDGSGGEKRFKICIADQLMSIRDEDLSKRFELAQDIHWSLLGPVGAYPIGGQPRLPGEQPRRFDGYFNGAGHAIIGMRMVGGNIGGLFAHIGGRRGMVSDLRLRRVEVSASGAAGAVAARLDDRGSIFRVHAEGTVSGDRVAGGLVGEQQGGSISAPYFEGSVTSAKLAGGIVGYSGAADKQKLAFLTQGHFNGTVKAPTAGGLVGHSDHFSWIGGHSLALVHGRVAGGVVGKVSCGALVSDAYAIGHIYSDAEAGGLAGRASNGRIRDSYSSVGFEKPGKSQGGAVGVKVDSERTSPSGPFVCSRTNTAPKPSEFLRIFYDSNGATAGAAGTPRTPEQLRNKQTFPKEWLNPDFNTWIFHEGFMPALNGLPRSVRQPKNSLADSKSLQPMPAP